MNHDEITELRAALAQDYLDIKAGTFERTTPGNELYYEGVAAGGIIALSMVLGDTAGLYNIEEWAKEAIK